MNHFDHYAFSAAPGFDEAKTRKAFARAVLLKTLVIYCYDPRATDIPLAVAKRLGRQIFPGEITRERVASSTTIFPVVVAGGRAIDALRSITVAQHLFGLESIAVVHHSYCGATTFTAEGIVEAYRHEHGTDIAGLHDTASICIGNYEASLRHDAALIRAHPGTPKHVHIFGYFHDIDTGARTEVVADRAAILEPA